MQFCQNPGNPAGALQSVMCARRLPRRGPPQPAARSKSVPFLWKTGKGARCMPEFESLSKQKEVTIEIVVKEDG